MSVATLGRCLVVATCAVCGGCSLSSHSCGMHTLTWDNYDGTGSASEAKYIFDGIPTGQGLQGFRNALCRIERLNDGSKVLLYPSDLRVMSDLTGENASLAHTRICT